MKLQDCVDTDCHYLLPGCDCYHLVLRHLPPYTPCDPHASCMKCAGGCRRSHRPEAIEYGASERILSELFECPLETMGKITDNCKLFLETAIEWNNFGYIYYEEKE